MHSFIIKVVFDASRLPLPPAFILQLLADVVQLVPPAALSGRLSAGERRRHLNQPGSGVRGQCHVHTGRRADQHQLSLQPVPEHREREQVRVGLLGKPMVLSQISLTFGLFILALGALKVSFLRRGLC